MVLYLCRISRNLRNSPDRCRRMLRHDSSLAEETKTAASLVRRYEVMVTGHGRCHIQKPGDEYHAICFRNLPNFLQFRDRDWATLFNSFVSSMVSRNSKRVSGPMFFSSVSGMSRDRKRCFNSSGEGPELLCGGCITRRSSSKYNTAKSSTALWQFGWILGLSIDLKKLTN